MELSPEQQALQTANRAARAKAAEKASRSEAEIAAYGLPPTTASFFSILSAYGGSEEEEAAIDVEELREEWSRYGDNTDDLLVQTQVFDLVEEREDGGLYISALGREALQHIF